MWLDYLVYSFGNYVIKLCIETGLRSRIDIVSNLDLVSIIFCYLFNNYLTTSVNNYLTTSAKC